MACMLNKCCACVGLRAGCLLIGYFNLVVEIIAIAFAIGVLWLGIEAAWLSWIYGAAKVQWNLVITGIVMIVASGFVLLLFVFTIVLLVGIHQSKRGLVRAYLVYSYVFEVAFLLGACGVLGYLVLFFFNYTHILVLLGVIGVFVELLVFIYFTLVIRSYHLKVADLGPQIFNFAA